jgi:hypothetical protein
MNSPASSSNSRPRLGRDEREVLLQHVLRLAGLYRLARTQLQPGFFRGADELPLQVVWTCACEALTLYTNDELPSDEQLSWAVIETHTRAYLERTAQGALYNVLCGPDGLFAWLFDANAALNEDWGRALLVRFVRERGVYDPLCDMIAALGRDEIPASIDSALDEFRQKDLAVAGLETETGRSAAPANYVPRKLHKTSTGIDFVDDFMNGGDAPCEVYTVLGAYSSGKTLFAAQLAYNKALIYQHLAEQGDPLRYCHVFHYEATYDEMLKRTWAHAAQIHTDSLEELDLEIANSSLLNSNTLSRRGQLKGYELRLFADEIGRYGIDNVDGEYERLQHAIELIRPNLVLHDFSGRGDNPMAGTGFIQEIAGALTRWANSGRQVGSVYIDYAGLCCRRFQMANNIRTEELRHLLTVFCDQCLRRLCGPFGCRVWIFHQFAGAKNDRSFGARLTRADAAECKSFGENAMFCFELGIKDQTTQALQFGCDKARRARGVEAPVLLYMRGELGTLVKASDLTMDQSTGKPVPLLEHNMIEFGALEDDVVSDVVDLSEEEEKE